MNILQFLSEKRKIGNLGERAAARYLRRNGYRIVRRNYTAADAEIDIIARKKELLSFVEVKTRNVKSLGKIEMRPASSVTPDKQRKIIKCAACFLGRYPEKPRVSFDVIEVYIEDGRIGVKIKEIKHIQNAFDKNTAYRR